MRKVEFELFSFNELTAEGKKNAIKNYRKTNEHNLFNEVNSMMLKESLFLQLQEEGIDVMDKEIYWSLSWCQGDGLVILGDITDDDIRKILKDNGENDLMKVVEFAEFSAKISHTSNYYHSGTMNFNFDDTIYYRDEEELINFMLNELGTSEEDIEGLDFDTLCNCIYTDLQDVEDYIKTYFIEKAEEFESKGYEAIEYTDTDEYIKDLLENNEHIEFLENGELY